MKMQAKEVQSADIGHGNLVICCTGAQPDWVFKYRKVLSVTKLQASAPDRDLYILAMVCGLMDFFDKACS